MRSQSAPNRLSYFQFISWQGEPEPCRELSGDDSTSSMLRATARGFWPLNFGETYKTRQTDAQIPSDGPSE